MKIGCMTCNGDLCAKCKHWTLDPTKTRRTQWGICAVFTNEPGARRQIYAGNIDWNDTTVWTTSGAKCRYFEGR